MSRLLPSNLESALVQVDSKRLGSDIIRALHIQIVASAKIQPALGCQLPCGNLNELS